MNKKLILTLCGIFLLGIVSAWVLNEWQTPQTINCYGDDCLYSQWHHFKNSSTEFKEFVVTSAFNNSIGVQMTMRDDGKFWLNGKAVCFSDGTSSDGGRCGLTSFPITPEVNNKK